jgi:hypothetical protein
MTAITRLLIFVGALLLFGSGLAFAQTCHTSPGGTAIDCVQPAYLYQSAGAHQQLSVTSGAVVTLTVPAGATIAAFTLETASIRMLDDGTAPTTTLGNVWTVGPASYAGPLTAMQFIAVSTTATLDVLYYKPR